MGQAEAVEPKTREELVWDKIRDRLPCRIRLNVVAANRKNRIAVAVDRDDVRKLDACRLSIHSDVLKTLKVQLNVHLKDSAYVIRVG